MHKRVNLMENKYWKYAEIGRWVIIGIIVLIPIIANISKDVYRFMPYVLFGFGLYSLICAIAFKKAYSFGLMSTKDNYLQWGMFSFVTLTYISLIIFTAMKRFPQEMNIWLTAIWIILMVVILVWSIFNKMK